MKTSALLLFLVLCTSLRAQLYFPPITGNSWETLDPSTLNWCPNKIDSLYEFLEEQNTKAFIVLKDGKIVLEQYFNDHAVNTPWYWASAGKTITAFLVGMAQQEGLLNIHNPSSDYLGTGWTSCSPEEEEAITVWHQLTMTTGLNDGIGDLSCTDPNCLEFLADPGTRWSYHNGPYTLLDNVISNASGLSLNQFTNQKLKNPTGMTGSFIGVDNNVVYFSTARSMARFGLLMLNNGNWNDNQIMTDDAYFNDMITTSQDLNRAYGYLWWLNGTTNFMVPGVQAQIPGMMMPNAPTDMITALGKNGQFLNVVQSENLVLIRMGEEPTGSLVPFLLNDKIWEYMNALSCAELNLTQNTLDEIRVFPNPSSDFIQMQGLEPGGTIQIYDALGREIQRFSAQSDEVTLSLKAYDSGIYIIKINNAAGTNFITKRVVLK